MRRWVLLAFVASSAWFGVAGSARADTTVRVVETFPAGDEVVLGRNQNFYLRLAYATDKPVHIWARPYFQGREVDAGSNPSGTYNGSGETFGWFFLMQPGEEVDEVRIKAGDGSTRNTPVIAIWRGHIKGGGADVTAAEPGWVGEMKARTKAEQDRAMREQMNKPSSAGDVVLFGGFMLAMLGVGLLAFAAPAWGLWRWRGGWRIAAAVPAAMMAFVVLRIVIGGATDPTSHNLWPFEVLQAGALSVVVMLALLAARKFSGAGR